MVDGYNKYNYKLILGLVLKKSQLSFSVGLKLSLQGCGYMAFITGHYQVVLQFAMKLIILGFILMKLISTRLSDAAVLQQGQDCMSLDPPLF